LKLGPPARRRRREGVLVSVVEQLVHQTVMCRLLVEG
jgi:hypothetical protein